MRFALASENTNKMWSFNIDMTFDEFQEWGAEQEFQVYPDIPGSMGNHYEFFVSDMESHGVLDYGGRDELELYHSYEIEEDVFPVILEKFREFFQQNGLKVGDDIEVGEWKS